MKLIFSILAFSALAALVTAGALSAPGPAAGRAASGTKITSLADAKPVEAATARLRVSIDKSTG